MSTEQRILEALKGACGAAEDNAHRARSAFRGLGPADLAKKHGQSGQTRAAILAEYEREHDEALRALRDFERRGLR